MNIYDQLLKLQIIAHAWEAWAEYRHTLTHYLMQHVADKSEIAIFGAGRCNDLDLSLLVKHFEQIILVDVDEEGMREALKKQGLENVDNITLEVVDFVGISPEMYRHFANQLVDKVRQKGLRTSMAELVQVAMVQLEQFEKEIIAQPLQFKSYKNIAVLGTHSQLIAMLDWIWQAILQTLGQQETSVRQKIMQMNTVVVQRFNEALIQSTQNRLIVGYEIERAARPGGIQGAVQAAMDFKARTTRGELVLCDFTQMDWPFDLKQGILYHMGVFTLEV